MPNHTQISENINQANHVSEKKGTRGIQEDRDNQ